MHIDDSITAYVFKMCNIKYQDYVYVKWQYSETCL